ncbi:DsbA family protein [Streptomyces sp. NPDC002004]
MQVERVRRGRRVRRTVIALVGATVVALGATSCRDDAGGAHGAASAEPHATPYAHVRDLPEKLAADGTTVVVGDPHAPTVVHLYEDPRCPVCKDFETEGSGPELRAMTQRREVRTEYTLASFLDRRLGGGGSRRAVNALRAALDRGRFAEYHEVLYAHQPEESVDGFTTAFLLRMASKVPGLRGPEFDAAVTGMKYGSFVTASQKAFDGSGAPGTPAMAVDGTLVRGQGSSALFDKSLLPLTIASLAKGGAKS